jgi:hypothetical protein
MIFRSSIDLIFNLYSNGAATAIVLETLGIAYIVVD